VAGQGSETSVLIVGIFVASVFFLNSAEADVIEPGLEQKLRSTGRHEKIPVIIKAKDNPDLGRIRDRDRSVRRSKIVRELARTAKVSQRDIHALLKRNGERKIRTLWIINGIALTTSADLIRSLANHPQVESIVLDAAVQAPERVVSFTTAPEWNIQAIHAPGLWDLGHTGQGIVVANMDTGVDYDHPDLAARWRGGTNSWFSPYAQPGDEAFCATPGSCSACELSATIPCDTDGHGTGTMGILTGGDAGGTNIGVAPGATWIAAKIFNDAGEARFSVIHESFQWLLDPDGDPDTDDAPDVVNASWGIQDPQHACNAEFQPDVQVLEAAEIALVFSAGNDGPNAYTGLSPANYPDSFAVGAADSTNTVWSYSSRGPSACGGDLFPTVVAPGVNVRTSDLYLGIPGPYVTLSGTSFAAPHVAGAFALLLSAFPGQPVSMIEKALATSATDLGIPGADQDTGDGLIDVARAYAFLSKSAFGVYRDGEWLLDANRSTAWDSDDRMLVFGIGGDTPVVGDWSGTRISKIGVVRGTTWFLDMNGTGTWDAGDAAFDFGIPGDIPVSGDWNATGITKIGVFRSGSWFLDLNGNGIWEDGIDAVSYFGIPTDIPITGDWNGDGTTKIGVYRQGTWYVDMNGNGIWDADDAAYSFGIGGDIPVTGDWNGDETADLGVVRGSTWFLDLNGNRNWDEGVDGVVDFGIPGDVPITGSW